MGDSVIERKTCRFCGHTKGSKAPTVRIEKVEDPLNKGSFVDCHVHCNCSCHRG